MLALQYPPVIFGGNEVRHLTLGVIRGRQVFKYTAGNSAFLECHSSYEQVVYRL